ncbi:universal stress protein [Shimia abyssi]|uniref:Nucleotide-binding universal stress UspA family protein n=1 Tax=Shimia abyssi TaxID=1662395 RepID=A0A2P8FGR3_9RHOB|nr:universal stress protein [Shimia abyssi]PSL20921.1 nucleotide-binding universal stress UspA family protein [Shimia abyssi]
MKSIVVATDLSPRSDRALHRALRLAAKLQAHAHVVSIVDDAMPEDMVADLSTNIKERLETYLSTLDLDAQTSVDVLLGDPVEQVNEFAVAKEAGLLVLGVHRRRGFLDSLRESTSERIVAASMVPVLIVKDLNDGDYETALAPVSFSQACANALRAASVIAPEAELRSYHALHVPFAGLTGGSSGTEMSRAVRRETEEKRDDWMSSAKLPNGLASPEIITGSLSQVLDKQVAEQNPDLIVCGTHTRGLAMHKLGSFAAELLRDPPADLLVSPPAAR